MLRELERGKAEVKEDQEDSQLPSGFEQKTSAIFRAFRESVHTRMPYHSCTLLQCPTCSGTLLWT